MLLAFVATIHRFFLRKIKKALELLMILKKILKKSNCKPKKIWVEKGSEFYNKSWLKKCCRNAFTHNEEKSVVAERFIRNLKNKIYKYMTSISKNIYIDKLDDIVNKYNNTDHNTIKMKHVAVKSRTYIDSSKKVNNNEL